MKSKYFETFRNNFLSHFMVVSLLVLLLIFSFLFYRNIGSVRRLGILGQHRTMSGSLLNNKIITIDDVKYIDKWMTFRYINFIFKMPESYLSGTLSMDDMRYPNISLWRYAWDKNIDTTTFLDQVKNSVTKYLQQNPIR